MRNLDFHAPGYPLEYMATRDEAIVLLRYARRLPKRGHETISRDGVRIINRGGKYHVIDASAIVTASDRRRAEIARRDRIKIERNERRIERVRKLIGVIEWNDDDAETVLEEMLSVLTEQVNARALELYEAGKFHEMHQQYARLERFEEVAHAA